MDGALVSAPELRDALDHVHVVDFRWYLGEPARGRAAYEAGHIPGAVFVDLEDVTGQGYGRHPLPTRDRFERAMRAAGVNVTSRVVVYDDACGSVAARLWWLLKIHGHDRVRVLDGGMQAWTGELETGPRDVPEGNLVADEPDRSEVVTYEELADIGDDAVVLDVRAPERYRGDVEPIDPIAGHVPGARNAFWQRFLIDDGRFASPDVIRARFAELGVTPGNAVVYCGSGVVACQTKLALEHAGLGPVRIYAGGWSDWSSRPGAKVQTGDA